jgi:hypothetical protein
MGGQPVYLKPDTLKEMEFWDRSRGAAYKKSINRVVFLTRCHKLMSNLEKLAASNNSPTVLWEIANAAVGKPCQPLPDALRIEDGNVTLEKLAAAGAMNAYYIEKVLKIRSGIASSSLLSPPSSSVKKNIRPPPELFSAIRNLLAAPGEPGRGKEKKCRVQL